MPKTPPKLSKLDEHIIIATKALDYPTKANISKQVVKMGGAAHIQTVYKRLKQKQFKTMPLSELRAYEQEVLHRELAPLATQNIRKVYKDNQLSPKERFSYDKIIMDKTYGETHYHQGDKQGISIDTLQLVAGNIYNDTRTVDETLIDVSSNDNDEIVDVST